MITNAEINNAILRHKGYKQYEGNKDNLSSCIYFFLMDASFSFFKDVKAQKVSGIQKKLRGQMELGYHLFFKDFFSAFNHEQTDYILEKVDDFEDYLAHHLNIAEIAIQECDNSRPMEVQREESRVWLCNILASDAQDFHGECWKIRSKEQLIKPLYNPYINQVIKASKEYAKARFGEGPSVTDKQFKRVQDSVRVIARKVADWLVADYYKEIAKNAKATC